MTMKFILITGASGDIGTACAIKLAEAGYSLYCHYYQNESKITSLVNQLINDFPNQEFLAIQADLSQEEGVDTVFTSLFQLDGIIFAHGDTLYDLFTDHSSQELDNMWHTHLKSPMRICQKCQSKLSHCQSGRIIFISSIYGLVGSSMEVLYSTLKGGQIAFANALSKEVASLGITVNTIAPGAVNTRMNQDWTEPEKNELLESIPLNRMADPAEIASLACFLLSSEASYITGVTLPVTGGWKI
ncbi:elongation factor P 5-aminopentanone reductase [Vagococcus sp.]|uniref:elongation factor P 5-aminopentanone reductase n=2 Tax=Enterococcaceae TaxID=81852 RepID=UPI002FC7B31C